VTELLPRFPILRCLNLPVGVARSLTLRWQGATHRRA